jgi:FlaA1/EpsC-like NDP-sugar epimerase
MNKFDLRQFIKGNILFRDNSFFEHDIENNREELTYRIKNKRILVIGGGGTIGSNFIKSVLRFNPSRIVVIDSNENSLTELVRTLRSDSSLKIPNEFLTYPISFSDQIFYSIYSFYKPFDIIANFAAHKHVRSEKDIFSIQAMVQNNVIDAYTLLSTISLDKPEFLFCVSTDKAASPVNIMGASKKIMERMVHHFSSTVNLNTARFANVAFSNGSLLEGFQKRLEQRQPISVPRNIKRFFVSASESGDICMLSCMLGNGGDIFFPKLDSSKQVLFYDIIKPYLKQNGYEMKECLTEEDAKENISLIDKGYYPVYAFDSDTDGEKLYEEFFTQSEKPVMDRFESLGVIQKDFSCDYKSLIDDFIVEYKLLLSSTNITKKQLVDLFSKHINDFRHIETGYGLDSKM